jgi:predicted nucleotidyltransferase
MALPSPSRGKYEQMNINDILQVLRSFKDMNAERYKIAQLGIFGSRARGERNDESDIDIVVVLNEVDAFNLVAIKQDLEETFRCHVDIVRYRENMNPFLRKRIERDALYV